MASRFPHRSGLTYTPVCTPVYAPVRPNRSGPRLAQPIRPMLRLSLNTLQQDEPAHATILVNEAHEHEVDLSATPDTLAQEEGITSILEEDLCTIEIV